MDGNRSKAECEDRTRAVTTGGRGVRIVWLCWCVPPVGQWQLGADGHPAGEQLQEGSKRLGSCSQKGRVQGRDSTQDGNEAQNSARCGHLCWAMEPQERQPLPPGHPQAWDPCSPRLKHRAGEGVTGSPSGPLSLVPLPDGPHRKCALDSPGITWTSAKCGDLPPPACMLPSFGS